MSSRTWTSVAAGIAVAAIAYFTFGAGYALTGFALGYAAAGIIQGPESPKSGTMRPDEFQCAQSSESAVIPVAFGTTRLAGNFLYYDKENFKAKPVYQEAQGGKGGGGDKQVSGYQYQMTFDLGYCMGPVDFLVGIQGSPGMDQVDFHAVEDGTEKDVLSGYSYIDRDKFVKWLKNFNDNQDAAPEGPIDLGAGTVMISIKGTREDSGICHVYPGDRTQERYRDVFSIRYQDFNMGPSSSPRTYLICVTRMPRVLNAAGSPILDFPLNASESEDDSEFGDANPAAIVWEFMTNTVWGKGISADMLNEDDFRQAALYFQATRLGVSTSVADDSSMVQLVQRFRDLFGLVTWWDGAQIRCRAMWDRQTAYQNRPRITPEDIIGEPSFSRQSMVASTNEVRVEFTNRENNWQSESATAQDLASIEQIGGVRSVKIDASEVGTRRAAELIAHRILRTMAYPPAVCALTVRRTFAHLQPGEFIELVVDGWRGDAMTTFWRLDSVNDDSTGDDQVVLNLIEDVYATGTDGIVEDFITPIPSMDFDDPLTNEDLVIIDYSQPTVIGPVTPTLCVEPNIWVSKNERRMLAAIQRRSGMVQSFGVGFREATVGNYINAGVFQSFAITGTLMDVLPITTEKTIRQPYQQFRITLTRIEDTADLLGAASAVQATSDGLDILTATSTSLMVIGNEVLRIGHIEQVGTSNEFWVRVAMRAEVGTDKAAHAIGDTFHFFPVFERGLMTSPVERLPLGLLTDVAFNPYTVRGYVDPTFETRTFGGESIKPLRPELVSATRVGTDWTIVMRPRIYNGGSGYGPSFDVEMAAREGDVGFHRLRIERTGVATVTLPDYFTGGAIGPVTIQATEFSFTPGDGTLASTGVWTLKVSFDTNPTNLVVYCLLGGQTSDPLTIPQPA